MREWVESGRVKERTVEGPLADPSRLKAIQSSLPELSAESDAVRPRRWSFERRAEDLSRLKAIQSSLPKLSAESDAVRQSRWPSERRSEDSTLPWQVVRSIAEA